MTLQDKANAIFDRIKENTSRDLPHNTLQESLHSLESLIRERGMSGVVEDAEGSELNQDDLIQWMSSAMGE